MLQLLQPICCSLRVWACEQWIEGSLSRMFAKCSIGFKLSLAKQLLCSALMWKGRVQLSELH